MLLFVAALILIFGQDHPAGKWSERHTLLATSIAIAKGHHVHIDQDEKKLSMDAKINSKGLEEGDVKVLPVDPDEAMKENILSTVDFAVNESLTYETAFKILRNPLTWLPALAYLTTFGLELTIDGQMANVLLALFGKRVSHFDQTKAGYYTSILWADNFTFWARQRLTVIYEFDLQWLSQHRNETLWWLLWRCHISQIWYKG